MFFEVITVDKNNIVKSTLYLNKDTHKKLKIESIIKGVSMKQLVEQIISEYLENNDTRPN